ncbi:MAG: DUF2956 family protein [Methylobacter sp.]|nr:MAG: DUF2956 family protein [Methylobacter sp.]
MNRKLKNILSQNEQPIESGDREIQEKIVYRQHWLPWLLLFLTWLGEAFIFSFEFNEHKLLLFAKDSNSRLG